LKQHVNLWIGAKLQELVVCDKAELLGTEGHMKALRKKTLEASNRTVLIPVCARDGLGLDRAIDTLEVIVEEARREQKVAEEKHLARMQRELLFS
jgi:hypothetical protein